MKIKTSISILMLFVFAVCQVSYSQQLSDAENEIEISSLASVDSACTPFTGPIYFGVISLSMGKIHANVSSFPGAISYNWYINGTLNTTYHSNGCNFNVSKINCDIEYDIAVEVIDSCGTSPKIHANAYMPCDSYFRISPNPAKGSINVSVDDTKATSSSNDKSGSQSKLIYSVRITDKSGYVKRTVDYKSGVKTLSVSLAGMSAGIYVVSVFDNVSWKSQSIIIE